MLRVRSVLPVLAASAAALAAAFAVTATDAVAQNCGKDAGGGCKTDGARCNPPNGGRCYTVKERRVLNCVCAVTRPPNALRSVPDRAIPPPTMPPLIDVEPPTEEPQVRQGPPDSVPPHG